MEDAKKKLENDGYNVLGGIISPVHDAYGKKTSAESKHRINMVELVANATDWISLSKWECEQEDWTPTAAVLKHFSREINEKFGGGIKIMLIGGGNLLASFIDFKSNGDPVWLPEDQEIILSENGFICIERKGTDIQKIINDNNLLNKNSKNIILVKPSMENSISSTLVRTKLTKQESIQGMVIDTVIDYIKENQLDQLPNWK